MKTIFAVAIAFASTTAGAAPEGMGATGTVSGNPAATTSTNAPDTRGTAAAPALLEREAGQSAAEFWTRNSKEGFLSHEQAMNFNRAQPLDWGRLDSNADGRVSQLEWTSYHSLGVKKRDQPFGAGGPAGRDLK
ncbi:MAG: hypothetical protein ACREV0_08210 [Burkholderiales bacterium]